MSGCQSAGVRVLHGHRQASCLQPHHLQEVAAPCHLHSRDGEPGSSPGPRGSRSPGLVPQHTAAASHPPPQPSLTAARSCAFSAREPPSQEQLRSFKAPDGPCVGAGLCVHALIPPLPPQASAPPTKAPDPGFLELSREGRACRDCAGRAASSGKTLRETRACWHSRGGDHFLVGHRSLESELWPASHSAESAAQRRLRTWGPGAPKHTRHPAYTTSVSIGMGPLPQHRGPVPGKPQPSSDRCRGRGPPWSGPRERGPCPGLPAAAAQTEAARARLTRPTGTVSCPLSRWGARRPGREPPQPAPQDRAGPALGTAYENPLRRCSCYSRVLR